MTNDYVTADLVPHYMFKSMYFKGELSVTVDPIAANKAAMIGAIASTAHLFIFYGGIALLILGLVLAFILHWVFAIAGIVAFAVCYKLCRVVLQRTVLKDCLFNESFYNFAGENGLIYIRFNFDADGNLSGKGKNKSTDTPQGNRNDSLPTPPTKLANTNFGNEGQAQTISPVKAALMEQNAAQEQPLTTVKESPSTDNPDKRKLIITVIVAVSVALICASYAKKNESEPINFVPGKYTQVFNFELGKTNYEDVRRLASNSKTINVVDGTSDLYFSTRKTHGRCLTNGTMRAWQDKQGKLVMVSFIYDRSVSKEKPCRKILDQQLDPNNELGWKDTFINFTNGEGGVVGRKLDGNKVLVIAGTKDAITTWAEQIKEEEKNR